MTADLRHLAIILDQGARKSVEYEDAALASTLFAMTEVAIMLYLEGDREGSAWSVEAEFAKLAEPFQ